MKTAYSYVRFSLEKQKRGDSLRRQTAATEAYCSRNGLNLDTSLTLQDLGVSAFRGKNATAGALSAFRDLIRQGRIAAGSVLVVESLDRLSRQQVLSGLALWQEILEAGVEIHTTSPEQKFTAASLSDMAAIMFALVILSRAREESETKSRRIRQAWEKKRAGIGDKKLTARGPCWLSLSDDKTTWRPIPDAVAVVKTIFRLAADGMGTPAIAAKLNADGVRVIGGRSAVWYQSSVRRILTYRAVLGEFTPVGVDEHGNRHNLSDPVPDYYPRVISDREWYAAQHGMQSRKVHGRGRAGKKRANLFTGILFNARDKSAYTHGTRGRVYAGQKIFYEYLLSGASVRQAPDADKKHIRYDVLERAFLTFVRELKASDIVGGGRGADEAAEVSGRLTEVNEKIEVIKSRLLTDKKIESLLDVLTTLEADKRALSARLDDLKRQQANPAAEALGDAQSLIAALDAVPEDQRLEVRSRLRQRILTLVDSIWVCPLDSDGVRLAECQVFFKGLDGGRRFVVGPDWYAAPDPRYWDVPGPFDLRQYKGWYDGKDPAGKLFNVVGHLTQIQLATGRPVGKVRPAPAAKKSPKKSPAVS